MMNKTLVKSITTFAATALIVGCLGGLTPSESAKAAEDKKISIASCNDINVISDKELSRRTNGLSNILLADAGDTKKSGNYNKDETVYVFTSADGTQKKIIVSDWLKNMNSEASITDASNLTDIKNVKGDEKFTQNGDGLTWDANGSDIYYQGTSTEKSPIGIKVSYKLDGKDITPEELAGKSGKVTIRFDYTNDATKKVKIKGSDTDISVPFTVITGMMLPEDKFSNIQVTNGKVASEGKNVAVVGVTFPGLKESLDLDKDTNVPEYFEVTADATDFELNMTLTCALPDVISGAVDTDNKTISDLKYMLNELSDGKEDLQKGVNDLKDGTSKLKDKSGDLKDGVNKLDDGAKDLKDGADKLHTGAKDLKDGAKKVSDGTTSVKDGAGKLATGATSLKTGADSLKSGVTAISKGVGDLSNGLSQVSSGASVLASSSKQITSNAASISEGAAAVDKGVNELAGSINTIGSSLQTQIAALDSQTADYKAKMGALVAKYGSETAIAANPTDWAAYNQMKGAVGALTTVSDGLKQQAASLLSTENQTKVKTLVAGADKLAGGASEFSKAVSSLPSSAQTLSEALTKLYNGSLTLKAGADSAAEGAGKLSSGADSLSTGATTLKTGAGTLSTGAQTLYKGTDTLYNGVDKLANGTRDLKKGTGDLKDGTGKLINGVGDLDEGAGKLKDGVNKLIDKLSDKDSSELIDRLDAVMDAGEEYTTFTKLADGQTGSVKFIIKTDAIKAAKN